MLRNESDSLKRVAVCTPRYEYARADNFKKHNIGKLGDPEIAIQQHDTLKSRLREFGAEVMDIPELDGHPNSVFTRDTALCTPKGYIKLRLGLESRRGEEKWMAAVLDSIGETYVGEIKAPGTVEGGDVVMAGRTAFIGQSIRTNKDGIRQLSGMLEMMGYEIRVIKLPDTILHLDKALMVLGPQHVLYCKELISATDIEGFEGIGISCGGAVNANIICLGNRELIIDRSNSIVIDRLEAEKYIVHDLDLGEFIKGKGGPNCLIMPIERGA
jgi:dimethylargininase